MIPLLKAKLRGMQERARSAARKAVVQGLLGLSAWLAGLAAIGFLTASAYWTLSKDMGPELAALLIGIGFMLLAVGLAVGLLVGLSAMADKTDTPADVADTPAAHTPSASAVDVSGVASIAAFTAAFVLGKFLAGDRAE